MGWKPFSFSVRVTHSVEGVKWRYKVVPLFPQVQAKD